MSGLRIPVTLMGKDDRRVCTIKACRGMVRANAAFSSPLLPNGRASCVMQQCAMKAYVASEYAAERPVLLHALLTINSVSCSGGMLIKAVPAFGIVPQLWCGGGCFRRGASRCRLRQADCGKPELSKAGHGWPAAATKQGQSRWMPFWPCFVGLRR
ncbi:MAG: hypothetical protein ABF570_03230 [Acetobacter syzygii]